MLGDEVFGQVVVVGTEGKIFLHHALLEMEKNVGPCAVDNAFSQIIR
jgi:hypothetical protein